MSPDQWLASQGGGTPTASPVPARDVQFAGDQSLSFGSAQMPQQTPQTSPYQQFGTALSALLQKSQQMGTAGFARQGFDAQQLQANRVSAQAPANLIGANPALQGAVRSASANAVNPTIRSAANSQQTFGEQLGGFKDAVSEARNYLKEQQAIEEQNRERAGSIIELAMTQGATSLEELLRTSPDVFKRAGYSTKEFEAILKGLKAREAEVLRQFEVKNAPSSSSSSDYSSYNSYGPSSSGPTGTVVLSPLAQAVRNKTISLSDLTPTERGRVAAELSAAGIPSDQQEALQSNLKLVNDLLNNPDVSRISGFLQGTLKLGTIDPRAQLALNQYKQLQGTLSLANRQQLQGSGAISDFEFRVLSEAASALGRNLNDAAFKAQLGIIRDVFAGKYARTQGVTGGGALSGTTTTPGGNVVKIY